MPLAPLGALLGVLLLAAGTARAQVAPPAAKPAAAPQTPQACTLQILNVDRRGKIETTPTGTNYFAGGNVRIRCAGATLEGDSVAAYGGTVVQFIGRVRYRDSTMSLDTDRGTYYKDGERYEARGNVVAKNLESGSGIHGPSLDYFRAVAGVRDTTEMYAVGRPRIDYAVKDSTGAPAEPYVIVADRVRTRGNDLVWAGGRVAVDRSDFAARGDSLRMDTGAGSDGTLLGSPIVKGLGADTFNLTGRRIDFRLEHRKLTYVVAQERARAVTGEWTLEADTIALDVNQEKLEQTFAWGKRATAASASYDVRAESLVVDTPDQRLTGLRAFRAAWLGGAVDSATGERDWIAGDSVRATFGPRDTTAVASAAAPPAPADSASGKSKPALRRMQATHDARAFQVTAEEGGGPPSLSYVHGAEITITMLPAKPGEEEKVDRVDVRGQVEGVTLRPSREKAGTPAAPAAARPPRPSPAR